MPKVGFFLDSLGLLPVTPAVVDSQRQNTQLALSENRKNKTRAHTDVLLLCTLIAVYDRSLMTYTTTALFH